ncbi:hypothetical protein ACLB6G_12720 [Zhengella sp. ZM62]
MPNLTALALLALFGAAVLTSCQEPPDDGQRGQILPAGMVAAS